MKMINVIKPISVALTGILLVAGCATTGQGMKKEGTSDMYYIVESEKTFEQAAQDLDVAVKENGFGVLHVHDLGSTLRGKGIDFNEECKVFEVCNPKQASKVLSSDMRLNMALPCRISVFTDGGKTKIGMIKPEVMLQSLSSDPALAVVAGEVEAKTIAMIDAAK